MKGLGLGATLVGVVLNGCAKRPPSSVGDIAAEARVDKISAIAKYDQQIVSLSGQVIEKGTKTGKETETTLTLSQVGPGIVGTGISRRVTKNYAYLVLASERQPEGKAVCLFNVEKFGDLAPINKGSAVELRCVFNEFIGTDADPVPVFYGCTVDASTPPGS